MLPAPRIIAIDDDPVHLIGLTKGLNQYGTACLQIHFTGDVAGIKACPHVRLIFADLHLIEGGGGNDDTRHFSLIGGLIEDTIKPSGPYVLVLWTRYSDQADALKAFLEERLKEVPKPFAVAALDKMNHLARDGTVNNANKLVEAIIAIISQQPQIAALLNWEERILGAAADTVSSVVSLAVSSEPPANRMASVGRLLTRLGVEAVGNAHWGRDRFHAVNEALLPILADRIAALRSRNGDNEMWHRAFVEADVAGDLSQDEAARLNRFLHIASATGASKGSERGAVIPLPDTHSGKQFNGAFGLTQIVAAEKQFSCKEFVENDARFRWVLVQAQTACDYAQSQPGPLPFYLGLDFDASNAKGGTRPAALWASPIYKLNGNARLLHVSARFQVSLPAGVAEASKPIYRLRDQLLADLIHRVHTHGTRPGIISFRE